MELEFLATGPEDGSLFFDEEFGFPRGVSGDVVAVAWRIGELSTSLDFF